MRLAVIGDYVEEGWPSMDLAAEMLVVHARALADVVMVRPAMPRLPRALLRPRGAERRFVLERALGRYVVYPAQLWPERGRHQLFHVADHSYAHLVLALPQHRTGVYCHDLDAFRAGFPEAPSGTRHWALSRLLLSGLRRARVVFHSTAAMREEILARELVAPERLVHAPLGVAPEFVPLANEHDREWAAQGRYVLHVGHLIPRKNPELLLQLFARLAATHRDLRLVQIGGQWSAEQARRLSELGLEGRVLQKRGISRAELAAAYRSAQATLLPSTAEGFGLPLIESLACGTPVVATDLPVLREIGGRVVEFCQRDALEQWCEVTERLLDGDAAGREERLGWASRYTWQRHANTILDAYRALA